MDSGNEIRSSLAFATADIAVGSMLGLAIQTTELAEDSILRRFHVTAVPSVASSHRLP